MKKKILLFLSVCIFALIGTVTVSAAEKIYIVRRGDNLWKICRMHNVKYNTVVKANPNLNNPRVIFRGQKIIIPGLTAEAPNQPQNLQGGSVGQGVRTPNTNIQNQNVAPRSSDTQSSMSEMTKKVVDLVNKERVNRGLQPLAIDAKLTDCAQAKAQDMVNKNYFAHNSPTYGSPFNMMEQWGIKFTAAGENIAEGQRTAEEVMTSWMNSPGHRSNILSDSFADIGVGVAKDKNGVLYWSQMFMRPAIGH